MSELEDARLEAEIRAALDAAQRAHSEGRKEDAAARYAEMKRLLALRSPEQIAKMERARGLR